MKAIQYFGVDDLRFSTDVEKPTIKHPDEVLIKVYYCGICGTDLLSYKKGSSFFAKLGANGHPLSAKPLPQVMGHEFSGELVELGDSVKDFKVGDRVVVEPTCYCSDKPRWPNSDINATKGFSTCEACKDGLTNLCSDMGITGLGCDNGGLAEYVVTLSKHLVRVPDSLPLDCAALVQPLAVSYHAFRTCGFVKGSSCLIVGCGSIGIGCIMAAKAFEAGQIVCSEPATVRRETGPMLGATAFNPKDYKSDDEAIVALKKLSPDGRGFDFAFDCSGFPITFKTGLECLKPRGRLVNLAIWPKKPMDFYPMDFTSGEKIITGSMCYTIEDFQGVIDAMADGRIDIESCKKLITKKVKLEDGIKGGFDELLAHKDVHIKILISPLDDDKI